MRGYFARPANPGGKLPGVLVIHENRGLNPYIEDVARRLAVENFVAFAPDALDAARRLSRRRGKGGAALCASSTRRSAPRTCVAAYAFLKSRPECTGKIGAVGFCFGGTIVNTFAVRLPDLAAAVPFYGGQPSRRGRRKDQGAAADPLRGARRAHQCRLARVRGGAQGEWRQVPDVHVSRARITASTTTRRRATTKPRPSSRGRARSPSSTRTCGRSA